MSTHDVLHPSIESGRSYIDVTETSANYFGGNLYLTVLYFWRANREPQIDELKEKAKPASLEAVDKTLTEDEQTVIRFIQLLGEQFDSFVSENTGLMQLIIEYLSLTRNNDGGLIHNKLTQYNLEKLNSTLEQFAFALLTIDVDPVQLYS